jgi:hypothetical protein
VCVCVFFTSVGDNVNSDGRDVQAGLTDRMTYQRHIFQAVPLSSYYFCSLMRTSKGLVVSPM